MKHIEKGHVEAKMETLSFSPFYDCYRALDYLFNLTAIDNQTFRATSHEELMKIKEKYLEKVETIRTAIEVLADGMPQLKANMEVIRQSIEEECEARSKEIDEQHLITVLIIDAIPARRGGKHPSGICTRFLILDTVSGKWVRDEVTPNRFRVGDWTMNNEGEKYASRLDFNDKKSIDEYLDFVLDANIVHKVMYNKAALSTRQIKKYSKLIDMEEDVY